MEIRKVVSVEAHDFSKTKENRKFVSEIRKFESGEAQDFKKIIENRKKRRENV